MKAANLLLFSLVSILAQSSCPAQSDDFAVKSRRAKELMAEGRFVQAVSLYRAAEATNQYQKLAELAPESSAAWYGLGRSYESLAVRAFDKLQKTAPESAYWLALVADARLRDRQFSSAFFLYRHALEKAPEMRGLHAAVAEIYRKTEHPDWARTEKEKELNLPQRYRRTQSTESQIREGQFNTLFNDR